MHRLAALVFALLVTSSTVAAQSSQGTQGGRADARRARVTFRRGVAAAHAGRWDAAAEAFRESHALSGRPQILLNLAAAEAERGHLGVAVEAYRRFLRDASPAMARRHGDEARRAMASLDEAIPRVALDVQRAPPDARVLVDGDPTDTVTVGELRLDPGPHRLELRAGERLLDSASLQLERGQRVEVTLAGPAALAELSARGPVNDGDASTGDEWWPWVVAAGGAVVVGVVVAVSVWAATQGGDDGFCSAGGGNFDTGCWTSGLVRF